MYRFTPAGEVLRFRYLGDGRWENDGAGETIATGRIDWGKPTSRNRMTIDAKGHFYGIHPDNTLRWWRYDEATKAWSERVIGGQSWGTVNLLVASGAGVLYARVGGALYRYHYDATSQRWVEFGTKVGNDGWQAFADVAGVGGDVLYALENNGNLRWYRYLGAGQWAAGSYGVVKGGIPADWQIEGTSDDCKLSDEKAPVRPIVTPVPHAPASLLNTTGGRFHYSYVDAEGRVVNAQATDLAGGSPIGFAVIPGYRGVTTQPSAAEHADGRVEVLALGLDSETRSNTQTAPTGAWAGTISVGGFTPGPATLVRRTDKTLIAYAVDEVGCLWQAEQRAVNSTLNPWQLHGCGDLAAVPLTAASSSDTVYLTLLVRRGVYTTTRVRNGICCDWIDLGGGGFTGPSATVIDGSGRLRLYARGSDGGVYTQAETPTGFPRVWTLIPGITAAGNPSAVFAPNGTLEVVVRATDGYVYNTGQVAPGSDAYRAWQEITDRTEQSSTDPTAVSVPDQNLWVVAYRDEDDAPKLRRAQPAVLSAAVGPRFVDIELQPAR